MIPALLTLACQKRYHFAVHGHPVRIGIIGTGFGAAVQLPAFLNIPEAKVMGMASTKKESSERLAAAHHLPHVFSSWEELVASPDIDLVSVASPQMTHREIVGAAIAAGKHVLCEKPFTLSSHQAQKLLDEAEAAGIIHGIDFEFRGLLEPYLQSLNFGAPKSADLQWIIGTWADPARSWGWQCDRGLGGGVMSALGVHLLDAAEWMFGPAKALTATTGITLKQRKDASGAIRPVTAEDYADITLVGSKDLPIHIAVSNVNTQGAGLSIHIEYERGAFILKSTAQDFGKGLRIFTQTQGKDPELLHEQGPADGDARIPLFQTLATRMVQAMQERDHSFRPSFAEGVRMQKLCEAVRKSAEQGSRVDIA